MDFRQDNGFSHVVSWCKKITGAKYRKKIYPALKPKTEYLFDLRDSVKEEMIKELMVGTKRTKEFREWLIKVSEFEINARELLQFHEKTSDNLRFSKKQPHADLMNVLDEITRLLESSPLQRATRTRSSSMIEGKSFGLAERTSNAYLRSKTEDPLDKYLEDGRSCATGKEVERDKEIPLIKYGRKLRLQRKVEGDQKPRIRTRKRGSSQAETKDGSTTTVGSMIDMEAPLSGNSGSFWLKPSLIPSSLSPWDRVDLKTKSEEVSSSLTNILPTAGHEIELISFEEGEEEEEEMKPSLRPEIFKAVLNEIEEISSSHETESETSLPAASRIPESLKTVNQSVEPPIEVGAFISPQREILSVDTLSVASSEEEILLTDEVETKGPSQTDAKTNVEHTVLKILEFLSNDTVRRIGVYGIERVGKTTVLKAFIAHPQIKDMFDLIIWVTVSKYWSIRKMQDEVLRQLSTDFKSESENREELFRSLEGRKFLLVLDDVWESIDLEAVGIPDPSSENGSAIILATRNLEVCDNMRFINMIEVGTLSNEEAWKLFCEQVGRVVNIPGILPFARVIVERCGGLPLLVIVTGRALSGEEDVFAWEQAFKQFSGPCGDLRNRNDVIQLLKFSFDRLEVHDIQSCFLHCAFFPEDQEVNISEFVTYCIEEGLIAGNTADAYKRGHEIITVLVHAFLLETTSSSSIIMHDMMRDLALAILLQEKGSQFLLRAYSKPVSQENHSSLILRESPENNRLFIPDGCQFILRAGSRLTQPPSVEEWGNSSMIFLMDNNLSALPESPSCPGLLTLFLQRNFRLRVIPVSFFDCMPCLKVLNLSNTRIKSLPRTISKLVSLETLILRHCERLSMLPSDIGSLKLLQVLDLRGTEINLLPDEIRELSSLTYFDICFYGSINRSEHLKLPQGLISSGIISRLSTLQSLGIRVCPGDERWDKCVKSIIYEVSKLTGLTSLSFYFPEAELLELFLQKSAAWIDQCLTEYNFVVGRDIKRIVSRVPQYVELDYDQTSQRLRFVNGEKIPDAIVKVLAYCSAFYLDHHLDVISISKFGIANMNKLKHCIVSECPTVKAVLDDKEFTEVVFPCLEHLDLHYLWNLEYICNDLLPEGSFTMLRILYVHACPKLKYVLKSSMLRFFLNLEELIVDDCTAIEKIILDDDMTTELSHMSDSSFKRLTLHYLPALVTIREGVWPSFEYISVCNCPNFKKINLDSKSKHTLKGIKGEKDWWDSLEWKEPSLSIHFNDLFTLVSEDDI
ncbi:disease resistance protein At4g27190 isoform X2 [Gossypium hirsutum]|nr:disease resistance protein At4g27190-like isoform X2 [Gossypium hirsutum]XP_016714004.2 disease resistance protein At4g27190-like isoform X2 [Gossypium hirsutum]